MEPTIAALREVIGTDQNVICVGFAMDALNRLANLNPDGDATPSIKALRDTLPATLKESPIRPWEALVRGGLNSGSVADFE